MSLSVIAPIDPALARMKRILFDPFDLGTWLPLGFCAFLMSLGEGGGVSFNFRVGQSGNAGGRGPDFIAVIQWIRDHLTLIIVAAVALCLVMFILGLVLTWLSSRGRFMFLDGVVRNRGAVVAPWQEYRHEGNSLFVFRFFLGIAGLAGGVLILGLATIIAIPDIQARHFGDYALAAIVLGVVTLIAFGLTMAVISVFLTDFVVPIMYLRRINVMAAWDEFSSSMLARNVLAFVLYLLMRIVISVVVGFLAVIATCATCCLAAIPYVGSVILLPLTVFLQAYSLYFIEQFGPSWRVFPPEMPPPLARSVI